MRQHLEGIILAAGESRRMGYPKPLLKIGGQTFIEHIAETMLAVVKEERIRRHGVKKEWRVG